MLNCREFKTPASNGFVKMLDTPLPTPRTQLCQSSGTLLWAKNHWQVAPILLENLQTQNWKPCGLWRSADFSPLRCQTWNFPWKWKGKQRYSVMSLILTNHGCCSLPASLYHELPQSWSVADSSSFQIFPTHIFNPNSQCTLLTEARAAPGSSLSHLFSHHSTSSSYLLVCCWCVFSKKRPTYKIWWSTLSELLGGFMKPSH